MEKDSIYRDGSEAVDGTSGSIDGEGGTTRKNRKKARGRKPSAGRRRRGWDFYLLLAVVVVAVIAAAAAVTVALTDTGKRETEQEAAVIADSEVPAALEREKIPELISPSVIDNVLNAGKAVTQAVGKRPPRVELTPDNTEDFASIESCRIDGDTGKIEIAATAPGLPVSDDKFYYLFEQACYEDGIPEGAEALARKYKDGEVDFSVNLNHKQTDSRLFSKFVLAVKKDGEYVAVSGPQYVTNPEAVARYNYEFPSSSSKKGLLVDPNKVRSSELEDLGVKHAAYNIPISRLIGQTTNGNYPTVYYTYNGRKYPFNGQVVAEYDFLFNALTQKGIITTGIILNNLSSAYPELIHPKARSGNTQSQYYAFNAAEASGAEWLEAIGAFLAERYSGSEHGRVVNWVIGNEVNARKEWNYMEHVDLETYTEAYADAFRIFYNAIKSVNANARVYIPLDQQWDRNWSANPDYDGRDLLEEFNGYLKEEGNIDWGLAQHPYSVPLTNVKFWNPSKYVKFSADTSMVTMDNIHVVTGYLNQEQFLTADGEVRPVILSELGYTSTSGEELQAAAFAYAYYQAEADKDIDAIILSRETDAGEEISQGLAMGLSHPNGAKKYIYNVFKYIDTDQGKQYTDFAKSIIGIGSWNDIVK